MIILETKRLALCELSVKDSAFIMELLNDPDWLQYIGDKEIRTLEDARDYILNGPVQSYKRSGFGLFLVKSKKKESPIGICGLLKRDYLGHIDLGFALLPKFRGKGYAAESALAVLDHGNNKFGFKHVLAIVQSDNIKSISVLNEIGFKYERLIELPEGVMKVSLFSTDIKPDP